MTTPGLLNLVLGVGLAIMIGWVLHVGQAIMVPVVASFIAVYVLVAATDGLSKVPVLSALPQIVLRGLVLAIFTLVLLGMGLVVVITTRSLIANAPQYEARLEGMVLDIAQRFGLETFQTFEDVRRVTLEQLDFQAILTVLLGSVTSFGAMFFVVVVYAAFLMGERSQMSAKVYAAFPDEGRGDHAITILNDINKQVGDYLVVKTLINIVLGVVSYGILLVMDVDFALFWALVIGLLNYIPYVGSLLGVLFPVLLSVAQFGSLQMTVVLAALLIAAQTFVGNFLEPRWIGRQLNLSPFVVLLALSIWTSLWGIPGAILAVPMTSVMVIILSSFPHTRFLAVFLAQRAPPPREDTA